MATTATNRLEKLAGVDVVILEAGAFRVGAGASTYRGLVLVGAFRKGPVPHLLVAATLHV
jgi:hypothetical protein